MSVYILTKKEQLKACMELASYMELTCGDVTVFTNDAEFYILSVSQTNRNPSASPWHKHYLFSLDNKILNNKNNCKH